MKLFCNLCYKRVQSSVVDVVFCKTEGWYEIKKVQLLFPNGSGLKHMCRGCGNDRSPGDWDYCLSNR